MKPDLYMPVPARIEAVIEETPNIKTFSVRPAEAMSFEAGQFIELTVPGVGEAPFTPSSSPAVKDHMEITIMRAGRVTDKLHSLAPGAEVGLRGPLGQRYPIESFRGREVVIVGGGVGLAPLRALLFALLQEVSSFKKIIIRYGAKTPRDIVFRDAVAKKWDQGDALDVLVTVDRGDDTWTGPVGVVTAILDEKNLRCDPKNGVAVVCGPPIMMKFATVALLKRGYPPESIYLSMEKNMSCGVGKCGHCRIGTQYACKDGPVFTYGSIQSVPKIWE
ncbi:MAG: FAD/NAD(P)-binding protein [Verrucomicrobia bacterium]|nr:FAD/NAD(P)-binding protein [Verrucomicrobiota bacterium]MBU1909021.1 FAD/NAD(P)-binding protein [Verrucomicrobiota bacterium]